jgi:hypothetical protein
MKKSLSYVIVVLFVGIAVSFAKTPDTDAIKATETTAWQTFKDKDAAGFKKVVDKDFKGVYVEGVSDLAKELSDMTKWDMKSFTISDYKSFSDEKDVIVTTYTVKIEGTYDGKDASGTYNAGSVWKQENGKWMAIFHTNVKQEATAK